MPEISAALLQLADALTEVSHLRSLDLGGNDIKAEGITALMKAIEGHKELRQLELGYNVIGAEGAQAVADALKYNPTVRLAYCIDYDIKLLTSTPPPPPHPTFLTGKPCLLLSAAYHMSQDG